MFADASIAQCVVAPDVEPVSLSEAKAHLRVDGSDEDALISACITAARERIEHECRRALIRQQWTAYIKPGDGCRPVELPRPRLIVDIDSPFLLEYRGTGGVWAASANPLFMPAREPAILWPAAAAPSSLDAVRGDMDCVWRATYWSGYGSDAASVPGPLRHAIMLLAAHLFERREIVISGATISDVPKSLDWMLDSYRVPWMGGIK